MATGYVLLPTWAGVSPDGSGTGNAPATPELQISTGTQTADSPKVSQVWLLYNATTAAHHMWPFLLPGNWASGGTLRLEFMTKGTSANTVRWKAGAAIGVTGTTDLDAIVFDTVVGVDGTPSTTQGITTQVTVALTMTNAAANRPIVVFVGRDPAHANDTNASVAGLVAVTFEHTLT